jgi:hypothetical protein
LAKRENTYRDNVRWTLQDYSILLWNIPDGFFLVNGQRISTPRYTDMHGLIMGSGKHVSCELKIGTHPVPSKFTDNETEHLASVEKAGGLALIVCIHPDTFAMSCFGWNKGEFVAITSMQNMKMRKESI